MEVKKVARVSTRKLDERSVPLAFLRALYEAFDAAHARALARRLEIHYTPVHGS